MKKRTVDHSLLDKAKANKKDEFYTQLSDIEKEMIHYTKHFKGKIVYCNCDDPFESNFFKYFVLNFNKLKLQKLICTGYATSSVIGQQLSLFDVVGGDEENKNKPYKAVVTKVDDKTVGGSIDMFDIVELFKSGENKLTELEGDGDFRSHECVEILKESDIVVTNPPFSLFRDYITQLRDHRKDFLIISNINAITYKEVFALIKANRAWLGVEFGRGISGFIVPEDYDLYGTEARISEKGERIISPNNCMWLTTLDNNKRHQPIKFVKTYKGHESDYPAYDNYEGINVNKTQDIPGDYMGAMGVPITFLNKYDPDQFEIIKFRKGDDDRDLRINGKEPYFRILIKRKTV